MLIKNKILTIEDVKQLNSEVDSELILKNTCGQDADVIRQLSQNVKIRVLCGYDESENDKYKEEKYVSRTYYEASDLSQIITEFEKLENQIDKHWTDLEKAIFVFVELVKNINYDYNENSGFEDRNMTSMLTKQARCAGFATCYKEAMDRIGVENIFINIKGVHSFNAIKISGHWRLIDVTWARNRLDEKPNTNEYLMYFCGEKNFLHQLNEENLRFYALNKGRIKQAYDAVMSEKSKNISDDIIYK